MSELKELRGEITTTRAGARCEDLAKALLERIAEGENPILAARGLQGLTQKELASRSRVAQATISKLERNSHSGSIKTMKAVAAALGVPVTLLVG